MTFSSTCHPKYRWTIETCMKQPAINSYAPNFFLNIAERAHSNQRQKSKGVSLVANTLAFI